MHDAVRGGGTPHWSCRLRLALLCLGKKYFSRLKRQQCSGNYQTMLIVIYHPGCNKLFKAGFCLLKKTKPKTRSFFISIHLFFSQNTATEGIYQNRAITVTRPELMKGFLLSDTVSVCSNNCDTTIFFCMAVFKLHIGVEAVPNPMAYS